MTIIQNKTRTIRINSRIFKSVQIFKFFQNLKFSVLLEIWFIINFKFAARFICLQKIDDFSERISYTVLCKVNNLFVNCLCHFEHWKLKLWNKEKNWKIKTSLWFAFGTKYRVSELRKLLTRVKKYVSKFGFYYVFIYCKDPLMTKTESDLVIRSKICKPGGLDVETNRDRDRDCP